MKQDLQIFELIKKERERQSQGLELIASENYVTDQVMEAMGSVCTNKYAEGYPGKRYYGGCEVVDQIEQTAIDRLCELFDAEYANVQPHSGAQANLAVEMAVLNPGDTFMGLDLSQGGHLTHGSPVNASGILYKAVAYGLDPETGCIDYDRMEELAKEHRPKLIIGGASAYSREWDYERMRKIADEVGALLWVDMAHTAGLIAAGLLKNPVKYAHIVTSTTHKTLRGPRGGVILMGKDFENPWGLKTPKGVVKKVIPVKMETPKSLVVTSFRKEMPYNLHDMYCNNVLRGILDLRYTENIREKEGGTYGVSVSSDASKQPVEVYTMTMTFNCDPDKADHLKSLIYAEIEKIKKSGVTEEEISKITKKMLKDFDQSKPHNSYWMSVITTYYIYDINNNDPADFEDIVKNMTPADIQDFVNRMFDNPDNLDIVFTPKK